MRLSHKDFTKILARHLDSPESSVSSQVDNFVNDVRKTLARGERFEVSGLGAFFEDGGEIYFDISPSFQAEINYQYEGLTEVDLDKVPASADTDAKWISSAASTGKPPVKKDILIVDDSVADEEDPFGVDQVEEQPATETGQQFDTPPERPESEADEPTEELSHQEPVSTTNPEPIDSQTDGISDTTASTQGSISDVSPDSEPVIDQEQEEPDIEGSRSEVPGGVDFVDPDALFDEIWGNVGNDTGIPVETTETEVSAGSKESILNDTMAGEDPFNIPEDHDVDIEPDKSEPSEVDIPIEQTLSPDPTDAADNLEALDSVFVFDESASEHIDAQIAEVKKETLDESSDKKGTDNNIDEPDSIDKVLVDPVVEDETLNDSFGLDQSDLEMMASLEEGEEAMSESDNQVKDAGRGPRVVSLKEASKGEGFPIGAILKFVAILVVVSAMGYGVWYLFVGPGKNLFQSTVQPQPLATSTVPTTGHEAGASEDIFQPGVEIPLGSADDDPVPTEEPNQLQVSSRPSGELQATTTTRDGDATAQTTAPASTESTTPQPSASAEATPTSPATTTPTDFGLQGQPQPMNGIVYSIIVHSLASEREAQQQCNEISLTGLRCLVREATGPQGRRTYRVAVGQFSSASEAEAAVRTLNEPFRSRNFITRIN